MRLSLILFVLSALLPELASAGPTITSVSGASSVNLSGTVSIFGGVTGDIAGCDQSNINNPCNTCTTAGLTCTSKLCACNTARIYDDLLLTIDMSNSTTDANGQTTTTSGTASATLTYNGSTTQLTPYQNSVNNGTQLQFQWSTICAAMGGDCESIATSTQVATATMSISLNASNTPGSTTTTGTDTSATTVTIKIIAPTAGSWDTYGSPNISGVSTFKPYPGDQKFYLTEVNTTTNFPSLGYSSVVTGIRVFYSTNNLPDATPMSPSSDISVDPTTGNLSTDMVKGLDNGQLYFVRLGMLDEAQNVVLLTPDPTNDSAANSTDCQNGTAACAYAVSPDEVQGLLSKDFNCFVATAAYGTAIESKLTTFREFRTRVLLPTRIGRRLNAWYYRNGPYAARFIADKPWLRAAVRAGLWPAWAMSAFTLRFGVWAAAALLVAMTTAGALIFARARRGAR